MEYQINGGTSSSRKTSTPPADLLPLLKLLSYIENARHSNQVDIEGETNDCSSPNHNLREKLKVLTHPGIDSEIVGHCLCGHAEESTIEST